MKEDFLHYLWKFKKFDTLNLKSAQGELITILKSGDYLELSGPDFFNAQIEIGNQKWAGNVEIHLKSSDWYLHNHEKDPAYQNVILHVVWENDTAIFREDNTEIPVLVLKDFVDKEILANYSALVSPKSWISCEKQIKGIDSFVFKSWQERLFFERLERKSKFIYELLEETNQDWEAVLFFLLAKNFGLNTNGVSFLQIAKSIPFSIIRKESFENENLEALFFGTAGLLNGEKEDVYFKDLKFRYFYLLNKYQLERTFVEPVQFFKLRPDNFPTIRLSQMAGLYHKYQNLFSKINDLKSLASVYNLFNVSASSYWQNHYQFDKESPKKSKPLSKAFLDLIVINTIIPIQFAYSTVLGEPIVEDLIDFMNEVASEKNAVIDKFISFGIKPKNAFESQTLLELKNEYCNQKACLKCAIGVELLKNN
ncbi:DUF2851 family protein [Flavobacterium quisquiliarum]|jgi:hypothetical protein|uniref:DUF2851 family protein n=1 Tax=Flavobacterium quisquiliarum TaxID=1834436 RepID=A0ABV8W5M4_9FLAO|nr:DUF2851 family protein [Flavobacterium quisquiliarum]MBW1656830.1 DUF2851 family protein [Flavobacterium quisquiliarum]NWK99489.1 DUF2851 domain-containing protein [Flavobacterium collinsii]